MLPALALAGTTGKVKGKVTDRETGEALPAANVTIVGTTLGAAADLNGEYIILNVPVGTYSLRATYIGYQAITVSNIKVASDLTTEVNFPLPTEAMAVGSVEIIAERPLVNKNATNAVRIATQEDVAKLPVRSVTSYVALSPGVVVQDDMVYIRGGRSDEVGYYLEGANVRDVFRQEGGSEVTVIPEALEEYQVQAGGYNAEYGGSNAGIVRQSLRSGTNDYRFTVQAETDNFSSQNEKFLDTYSYGYTDYTATLSGPLLNKKAKFFLAGQNVFQRDRVVRFLDGFKINNATTYVDENNFPLVTSDPEPNSANKKTFDVLEMKPGNVPQASLSRWTGNGTLVYEQKPFIFRLSSAVSWQRTQNNTNGNPILNLFRSRVDLSDLSTGLYNLKVTHLVNAKTFYEVNLNYFDRRAKTYDPVLGDNFYLYRDSLANAEKGYIFDSSYLEPGQTWDIAGFNFVRPSAAVLNYTKDKRNYMGGSLDLTSQYQSHEFKLGASYQRYTVRRYSIRTDFALRKIRTNPDDFREARAGDPVALGDFRAAANVNNFGYDEFGNEINGAGFDGPKHPQYFSAYVQDKFEAKDLVINAGARFDVIDNDDFVFLNPTDPAWDPETRSLIEAGTKKKDAFVQVSPRLGFAFPVTDRTVFHMQYGKFIQAPALRNLYVGEYIYDRRFTGGFSEQDPQGIGLDPERTTQYEIGFNQQFADNASFDITVFYKDIKGQLQVARVRTDATALATSYNVLVNGDFATTKGLEFSMTLRRTNRVSGQINYTLSSSRGTGSVPNGAISGIELIQPLPTVITPLEFNQPHRGSVNFDYRFAKGDGGPILQQMGLNLLFTFNSGHPYTRAAGGFGQQDERFAGQITDPRSRRPQEALNASLTPWNFNLDLRLDKTINFDRFAANLYFYVQNLTNAKNVINVFNRTGNAYDDGFLTNPDLSGPIITTNPNLGDRYIALHERINLANGFNYSEDTLNLLFASPRQIRVGVRLEY
jgi:hypothetical protein